MGRAAWSPVFFALLVVTACAGSGGPREDGEDTMIEISNDRLSLIISGSDGSIMKLRDRVRALDLVDAPGGVPFRLDTGSELETGFESFRAARDTSYRDGTAYELVWTLAGEITLRSRVVLASGSDELSFTAALENRGDRSILAVEYPVVGGIRDLGKDSALAHSYVTGILIHDPYRSFTHDGDGLRFMPYPESFSGASMQFFAYYAPGAGGLYFAAHDGSFHSKWLNAYRMGGKLEASQMWGYEDVGKGKSLEAPWPFVIRVFAGDRWETAADIYKAWAVRQVWCEQGTLLQRGEAYPKWLYEDVGLTTFGIDASYDRTPWLRRYHEDIGTPIFHVLGPDWPKVDQNFYNSVPGGMADWFPTRFSRENLDLIREQGDYVAPFEFDFLVDPAKSDGPRLAANLQLFPVKPRSHDAYAFRMLCPATEFARDFHVQRDVRVLQESGVDSMYYDISANNLIHTCLNAGHGHPVGGGHVITEAYRTLYAATREALSREKGRYVPLGTEMMNEVFLGELDYYQARAWAQPSSTLETWPLRSLMRSGAAEMIPLFTYVYHEYGPQRMDGWGKLVAETGELFYSIVAKTYLWGGLYELNHEYSPMEALRGRETAAEEHYWKFDPQGFEYDADRAAYVAKYAALRVGELNTWLAYGVMLPAPATDAPAVRMGWYHYNHGQKDPSYRARGTIAVPSVIASAWRLGEGSEARWALLFANPTSAELGTTAAFDAARYGLAGGAWKTRVVGPARVGEMDPAAGRISLSIPAREVVAVIVEPEE